MGVDVGNGVGVGVAVEASADRAEADVVGVMFAAPILCD